VAQASRSWAGGSLCTSPANKNDGQAHRWTLRIVCRRFGRAARELRSRGGVLATRQYAVAGGLAPPIRNPLADPHFEPRVRVFDRRSFWPEQRWARNSRRARHLMAIRGAPEKTRIEYLECWTAFGPRLPHQATDFIEHGKGGRSAEARTAQICSWGSDAAKSTGEAGPRWSRKLKPNATAGRRKVACHRRCQGATWPKRWLPYHTSDVLRLAVLTGRRLLGPGGESSRRWSSMIPRRRSPTVDSEARTASILRWRLVFLFFFFFDFQIYQGGSHSAVAIRTRSTDRARERHRRRCATRASGTRMMTTSPANRAAPFTASLRSH